MIYFTEEHFAQLNTYLESAQHSQLFILVDENTHEHCLPVFLSNLRTELPFEIIEIEAGEEMKNIETAVQLWEILTDFRADRKSLLINLGGGVISDLGGFVASTYKRGIDFINIPTSLLAICDASVGGKTGIDLRQYKNLVGTFSEAAHTFIYTDFLKTLPENQLRSGFAEMLKHGLIADESHYNDLIRIQKLQYETVCRYIEKSVFIKKNIVEQDFEEANIRKILNFGHTIGHAIESCFLEIGKPILHGEAVAAGIICETFLSAEMNFLDDVIAKQIISGIRKYYPKLDLKQISKKTLFAYMKNDKKNNTSEIKLVLLKNIGNATFDVPISQEIIYKSIDFYIENNTF